MAREQQTTMPNTTTQSGHNPTTAYSETAAAAAVETQTAYREKSRRQHLSVNRTIEKGACP